jgi:hypothetical protein
MTRHIAGIVLFSFIIGISGFVLGAADSLTPESVTVRKTFKVFKKRKKRKRRHRHPRYWRKSKVSVIQAVHSKKSGLLNVSMVAFRDCGYGEIQLHFFAKDRNGARYLQTQTIPFEGGNLKYSIEIDWLNRMDRDQNVYVMAEYVRRPSGFTIYPRFDDVNATPVLMSQD